MLNRAYIDDLIHMRLPEEEARKFLLDLTTDKIDVIGFRTIVDVLKSNCVANCGEFVVEGRDAIDCCGTGGSGISQFNCSTAAAFVLAAGGVKVIKFGNRAASSASGSFDFLEALGVPFDMPLVCVLEVLRETRLAFLYAPLFYPALKDFAAIRRSLGARTVFNFTGPLLNPSEPAFRLLGVADSLMQSMMAMYLRQTGRTINALVVRGANGLDELDCEGLTHIYRVTGKQVFEEKFTTQFAKSSQASNTAQAKASAQESVNIFIKLISGEDQSSYYNQLVAVNAGAGFYAFGKASSIPEGAKLARELMKNGAVSEKVEQYKRAYAKFEKYSS